MFTANSIRPSREALKVNEMLNVVKDNHAIKTKTAVHVRRDHQTERDLMLADNVLDHRIVLVPRVDAVGQPGDPTIDRKASNRVKSVVR
jgi:hypothetical protein